ncbi:Lrp/AsnC family transcriptional regulator [Haladaptatus sp. F3-133]|jgi:DNA-binding Lrp family transcriptional regulator|uniref:Lrp/AsnC family transcriptional regulator n=1 Tax=Halorutilus salinus TaxID=2487751 RepID=A0A9Q4C514_9EURY|nr:Lrp/AsnC family transcriptional regulator [Halorutilus salinus]MCX2819190.1 Lrp/AsnC family transcriptional regulator [Halorutilus salinus]
MDETDSRILEVLKRDARKPYTEVAEEVGTSEGTVRNRVESMVDDGVIRRFTVSTSVGNVRAMIEVEVDVDVETSDVSDRVVDWDGVDFVWEVSGDEDMIVVVDVADTSEVNDLITRMRQQEETVSTRTRLILDERI